MRIFISFIAGPVFGLGLWISGMTDTAKVQGWLDLFGNWDPTLAFVLGGGIIPMVVTGRIIKAREKALVGDAMPAAPRSTIDAPLLYGSALFGFGWAVVGLCPGPSVAVLGYGGLSAWIFFSAMVAGFALHRMLVRAA